jgi:hypothetical protein
MKKFMIYNCLIILFFAISCIAATQKHSGTKKIPLKTIPTFYMKGIKPIKAKSYHGDTICIIWYDRNGDGKCDFACMFEKEGDYFIVHHLPCAEADDIDQFILEPCI